MAQKGTNYRVKLCYEGIPAIRQKWAGDEFMRNRNKVVDVFNEHINAVNDEWDLMGDEKSGGENEYGLDQGYVDLVIRRIQPAIDELNKSLRFVKYRLNDQHCNIEGYCPRFKDSKIWVELDSIQ